MGCTKSLFVAQITHLKVNLSSLDKPQKLLSWMEEEMIEIILISVKTFEEKNVKIKRIFHSLVSQYIKSFTLTSNVNYFHP